MKLRFWTLGVVAVSLCAATAFSGSGTNCQEPNPNRKKCAAPENDVGTCTGFSENDCPNKSGYSINDFPDGAVSRSAPAAYTHEVQRDCYKQKTCFWDTAVNPPACKAPTNWSPWTNANKTEIDESRTCY